MRKGLKLGTRTCQPLGSDKAILSIRGDFKSYFTKQVFSVTNP